VDRRGGDKYLGQVREERDRKRTLACRSRANLTTGSRLETGRGRVNHRLNLGWIGMEGVYPMEGIKEG